MTSGTPKPGGNTNSGPESIDQPFKERRRNLGRKSGGKVTRADAVARALAKANTVREMGEIAIRLGTPEALVRNILNRPHRNSIKVMHLNSSARHHYKKWLKAEAEKRAKRYPRGIATRVFRPERRPR
jgi:hypothetical protein